jgi:adenylate cyclase
MARIVVNSGTPAALVFELKAGPNHLGRAKDSDISIPHESLSRRHARIDLEQDSAQLVDLASRNGVMISGLRITAATLRHGDEFTCGSLRCLFLCAESAIEAEPPVLITEIDPAKTRPNLAELLPRAGLGPARRTPLADQQQAHERLRVLLRVSELLSSPEPIGSVFRHVLHLAFQILPIDHAAVLLLDDKTGALTVCASHSRSPMSAALTHSRHVVEEVLRRGTAALFSDVRLEPRFSEVESITAQSIFASMCAVLRPREHVIGVLYLDNRTQPNPFGPDDLEFLVAFSNHAAIAIDNSRLRAQLEEQAVVHSHLLRFFPPSAAARILEAGSTALETVEAEVTPLFCDISGFTALCSSMRPSALVELLNAYFEALSEVVFRFDGTLEKYIGDALLAVWGVPFARPDDASLAVQAAIDMQRALAEINQEGVRRGHPHIALHIGLNTGLAAAGNIGSKRYLQYATVGDTTNIASRICAAAAPGEILITDSTRARLEVDRFRLAPRPPLMVKGKADPLMTYQVAWELHA